MAIGTLQIKVTRGLVLLVAKHAIGQGGAGVVDPHRQPGNRVVAVRAFQLVVSRRALLAMAARTGLIPHLCVSKISR